MILIIENANIITITPMTPHITALLAVSNFPGSPWAVKNIIPAVIKSTITTVTATGHTIRLSILLIISVITSAWFAAGWGVSETSKAKVKRGSVNKIAKTKIVANFLFIFQFFKVDFLTRRYRFQLE